MRIQNIVTLAFTAMAALGLIGCEPVFSVSEQYLKYQLDSVEGFIEDGTFARTAKVLMPNIENDHSYSVAGNAIMPAWHLHPGRGEGLVNYQVTRHGKDTMVALTFLRSTEGHVNEILFIKNGACDDRLTLYARCSDVAPSDWRHLYDDMVGFARKHGGQGRI